MPQVEGHEAQVLRGAMQLLSSSRPFVVTEAHAYRGKLAQHPNDRGVEQLLKELGYEGDEIPEVCGWERSCRNRIWWPSARARADGLATVGAELNRPLVNWINAHLP